MTATTLGPHDLQQLRDYRVVLVSGPQRSGTNFVSHCVAYDTGLALVPETAFAATWPQRWWQIANQMEGIVIHCPGMCRWLHMVGGADDVAVLVVRRAVSDIKASQERIGWQWEPYELMLYDRHPDDGPIATVKYEYWHEQQHQIANAYEVQYSTMQEHPLWVPADRRQDFAPRQVLPEAVRA